MSGTQLRCPACGSPIKDAPLRISLEYNTLIYGAHAIKLTPKQAEMLWVLRKAYPNLLAREMLLARVWGQQEVEDNAVRTMVSQTRKIIEKIGWTIRPVTNRGYVLASLSHT